jgi:hypothetical protein
MRLSKAYHLSPSDATRIRLQMTKGCFVLGCFIPLGIIASILLRGNLVQGARWLLDLVIVLAILFVFQRFLREAAMARLEIGREYAAKNNHEGVVAALEPFAYAGSRIFDSTGEANYLLGKSAKELGENYFAKHCLRFVANAKRGAWSEKAKELIS